MKKTVSNEEILALIEILKPINTDIELIRVGGDGDGGYLIPNDLDGIEFCFSPGVGNTALFEEDLAKRGVKSFLADHSVDEAPTRSEMVEFDKKYVGAVSTQTQTTLGAWVEDKLPGYKKDMILQMDIESAEYEVFLETPAEILKKFRIMAVEFHRMDLAFNRLFLNQFKSIAQKISRYFHVVHIHPNNRDRMVKRGPVEVPLTMEFSFLRKDRVKSVGGAIVSPHPLDRDNVTTKPAIALPDCWRK